MKTSLSLPVIVAALAAASLHAADPRTNSWLTINSGEYARIYTNAAAQAAGVAVTAWSNGSQTQSQPAYRGVQEVYSSSNWVYLRSTGLGEHIMGPWSVGFPNLPANTHVFYRIPRNPAVPASKTLTGLGAIGYFVDGVAMFDTRDAFYWNGSSEVNGNGFWNREAYVNEGPTFDPANAHQENTGTYHYHANPIALRYLLGDNVLFNSGAKTYSEITTNMAFTHSPVLGWVRDGFPVYGPYGYSNATNPASGVRRMISGYVLRNGSYGTSNLTANGRTTIPAWALRAYGAGSITGPAVSATYPLGRYMEDNDYLGDLGYTQGVDFDLDEFNGRYCVTPDFPNGTYAYFVCISSNGTPVFPYNIGRRFYGDPTGGAVSSLSETVVTNLLAGAGSAPGLHQPVSNGNGTVTLVWSSVEGGTYQTESSTDLSHWTTNAAGIPSQGLVTQTNLNAGGSLGCFRVARTGLAAYDPVGGTASSSGGTGILSISPASHAAGGSFTLTINLDPAAQPAPPPQNAPINSITLGSIAGTGSVHVSQNQVTTTITIPANAATGAQTVTVVFPGPPGNPSQTVTYTLVNGFTIN